jgi:hypothetical protein
MRKQNKPIRRKFRAAVKQRIEQPAAPKEDSLTLRQRMAIASLHMFHHQVNVAPQEVAIMAWEYADAMLKTQKPAVTEEAPPPNES